MRKEMIIRVETSSEKGACCKAVKVAAGVKGVESVTLAGEDRNLLLVIGVGVDSNRITKKLRQKVGHAEVVELRTVDAADELLGLVPADHAYRYHPSPYNKHHHHQHHAAARDHYYNSSGGGGGGGGGGYPRDHYNSYNSGQSAYPPPTVAAGARDYQYGYGGGYPAHQYQHQQQHLYQYQTPASNMHTVVHHEYANDPNSNSCSIM